MLVSGLERKKSVSEFAYKRAAAAVVGRHIELLVEAARMGFEMERMEKVRVGKGFAVSGLEDKVNETVDMGFEGKNKGSE